MSSSRQTQEIESDIDVQTRYVSPSEPSLPALAVRTTRLVDTYMLWVGTTDQASEEVGNAPLQGFLARDWACAMPPRNANTPAAGTELFRSSSADAALPMAQRLTRRFKKQIFLSVDIPPSFQTLGQGSKLALAVEKAIVEILKELERVPG